MADKFLVIDGSSLIHRAFFALPPLMTKQGVHTGAVYGFCNMLLKLLTEVQPKYVAVAFDKSRKTFRTDMFPDYKGQRKPTPPELKSQFPLTMEVLATMGIASLELDNYEADDIIGTFAVHAPKETQVIIVTGDKDELQLIDDRTTVMYTKRGISDIKLYDKAAFAEDYEGLVPKQLIDLKGLMGDTSDNIPGVPGVGPKTALKLIVEYGRVEKVLENIDKISGKSLKEKLTNNREQALLSKQLATIFTEVPVPLELEPYLLPELRPQARARLQELEFRNLFERFAKVMGVQGAAAGDAFAELGTAEELPEDDTLAANTEPATEELGGLFGEATGTGYVSKIIGTKKEAEELFASLAKVPKVWFTALSGGEIPSLYYGSVQLYEGTTLYEVADECLEPYFTDWLCSAPGEKITCDCKEIYKVAYSQNKAPVNITEDLALAAYVEDPGRSSYKLQTLIERYLVNEPAANAAALPKLETALREQLENRELTRLYRELELPLAALLAKMELAGVTADEELLEEKSKHIAGQLKELEAKAKEQAEDPSFNPKSPKQLGVILFEKLGLPVIKKTKTGYSTDVSVLEQLEGKHPLITTILEHRVLAKLYSTYLEGLKPLINKTDGRIHTHFQQMVTVTGRLSSTDPNLQNIPTRTELGKEIRGIFKPGKGYDWLLSCDYSQIELRILAHIAEDKLLLESFRAGQDVHARTASEVFGVPLQEVSHEMRSRAKAVNFGIVYGISDFGLAKQLGCTRKEAAQFIESYFARYTGVKAYMEKTIEQARQQGYVSTLLGRRRYLPDIRHSNFNLRSFAERTAINTPIQGTAADIMKLAMLRVEEALLKAGVKARVLLQVHDELVLEVSEAEREQTAKLVQEAMETAFQLSVPLTAEVNYGKDWAEAK